MIKKVSECLTQMRSRLSIGLTVYLLFCTKQSYIKYSTSKYQYKYQY